MGKQSRRARMSRRGPMFPLNVFQHNTLHQGGLQELEMKADGNCFYRAVAHHRLGNQNQHMVIRKKAIEFFRNNQEMFLPYMDTGHKESSGTIAEFIHENAKSRTFATDQMIIACCRAWALDLHIIADTEEHSQHYNFGPNKVVVLYKGRIHYDTAVPKSSIPPTLPSAPIITLSPAPMSVPIQAVDLSQQKTRRGQSFTPYSARQKQDMLWRQLQAYDQGTRIVYKAEMDTATSSYITDRRRVMHGWTIRQLLDIRPSFTNSKGVEKLYTWQDWKYDIKMFQFILPTVGITRAPEAPLVTHTVNQSAAVSRRIEELQTRKPGGLRHPHDPKTRSIFRERTSAPLTSMIIDEMRDASLAAVSRIGDGNTKGDTLFDDSESESESESDSD
jgi:hypothetical protein